MKIGMAQISTDPGDIDGNVTKIKTYIDKAIDEKCDIVVFPELTIPGYIPLDLIYNKDFIKKNRWAVNDIRNHMRNKEDICVIFGYIDEEEDIEGNLKRYNTLVAIYIDGDEICTFKKDKKLLPDYDIFYEKRYFSEPRPNEFIEQTKRGGRTLSRGGIVDPTDDDNNGEGPIHTWTNYVSPAPEFLTYKGKNIGLFICEDLWDDGYDYHPVHELTINMQKYNQKLDYIVSINGSPFTFDKDRTSVIKRFSKYCPVIYTNRVGAIDGYDGEIVFDGESGIFYQYNLLKGGIKFKETLIVYDEEEEGKNRKDQFGDINSYHPHHGIEDVYNVLTYGLKDYARRHGFEKVLVSVSGGIDSAVVAALAVDALGAENVYTITLPSSVNHASGTLDDAEQLMKNLNTKTFGKIGIQNILGDMFMELKVSLDKMDFKDLTLQNMQARIRGNYIMAISNELGLLVLSTGNKTEIALGYCTLYGDMAGGLAVIGDVGKPDVYRLAKHINMIHKKEVIPNATITRPPSAELTEGQTDEEALGAPYSVLDCLVTDIVEKQTSKEDLYGEYENKLVDKIYNLIKRAEYKRRQAPPAIKVTNKAFGIGRRMPMEYKYND